MHRQHMRPRRQQRDRRKILDRVVGDLAVEHRVRGEGAGDEQQRIAVGLGARRGAHADVLAAARHVLDQDVVAPCLGELLRDHARADVIRPAGRDRHDDAHRTRRIGLRERGGDGERDARTGEMKKVSARAGHGVS